MSLHCMSSIEHHIYVYIVKQIPECNDIVVHCTVYTYICVHCTMYNGQCTMYTYVWCSMLDIQCNDIFTTTYNTQRTQCIHCTLYMQCNMYICNVHCTVYNVHCIYTYVHVHCTLYNVHCTLYSVRFTLYYNVQCTSYTDHCTLYSVHISLHSDICFTISPNTLA